MHVALFNTYLVGGAARASLNLFQQLQKQHQVSFVFKADTPHAPCMASAQEQGFFQLNECLKKNIWRSLKSRHYYSKTKPVFKNKPEGYEQFSLAKQADHSTLNDLPILPGIIHLHWVADWFDLPNFFAKIPDSFPIVWTLHDMNPLSGGCHFSNGCQLWQSDCHTCNQLGEEVAGHAAKLNLQQKLKSYSNKNITVVSPSHWLTQCAQESSLFKGFNHFTIFNGVDIDLFQPSKNTGSIRQKYNIPENKTCILFIAQDTKNRRKGGQHLEEIIEKLPQSDFVFLVVGEKKETNQANVIPTGYISDKTELAAIYSAADIYLSPALEDNLPNTVLESLACGTPVIAFNIGGMPDMVIHGKTGLLAEKGNVQELCNHLSTIAYNDELRKKMQYSARQIIKEKFNIEIQARTYLTLYKNLLNKDIV